MNEMKPEDVMKALDILDKMDFFQGQRAGRELWSEKPFEVQNQDVADFSQGVAFVKSIVTDALALLRRYRVEIAEKDGAIENLTAEIADWELKYAELSDTVDKQEAEIERLINRVGFLHEIELSYALQYGDAIDKDIARKQVRAEAINEFAQRLKGALGCGDTILGKSIFDMIDATAKEALG